jgi:simple sugar transport system permease protein
MSFKSVETAMISRSIAFRPSPFRIVGESALLRLILIDAILFLAMSLAAPGLFLSSANIGSMAVQFPGFGILALAMAAPMLTGGVDLSIISISNLSAISAALFMQKFAGQAADASPHVLSIVIAAIFIALLVGTLCGFLNGLIIAEIGVSPILATLATSLIFAGFAIAATDGAAVFGLPSIFSFIGDGQIAMMPIPTLVFAIASICLSFVLSRTAFGAKIYLLGANVIASRFAGIDNRAVTIKTYVLSGAYSAVAGLVIAARVNSAKADYGAAYLLLSILICVLGGINPFGGSGRISGVVLAVLALQFLSSGLNLVGVNNFATEMVWGGVLLAAMALNQSALLRRK